MAKHGLTYCRYALLQRFDSEYIVHTGTILKVSSTLELSENIPYYISNYYLFFSEMIVWIQTCDLGFRGQGPYGLAGGLKVICDKSCHILYYNDVSIAHNFIKS